MREDMKLVEMLAPRTADVVSDFKLCNNSRVAVIGAGPAGSIFSYFLLSFARSMDLDINIDIFESRDFSMPAPRGCNMCGGIVSESLVQMLALEGIKLPETLVQRGIDSYILHMDAGIVHIETPFHEMRIAAVYRGAGPRDIKVNKWGSFDAHLLKVTETSGAHVIHERVTGIKICEEGLQIITKTGASATYDLLAVAAGINTATLQLFSDLDLAYVPPTSTKTFIREYYLGEDTIKQVLGSSMHVFLLDIPRLEFAAVIPKGDYVTVCLLGENIDEQLYTAFLNSPEVADCMPSDWSPEIFSCQCTPRMNVAKAVQPFDNRIVFLGDSGITRLYKDGIGGAYRAAKAAASTAIFHGVSQKDFAKHYLPAITAIDNDNSIGRIIFMVTRLIKKSVIARRAILKMTAKEQRQLNNRRMSMILWDMFTGSAPYRDIFWRALNPMFLTGLFWNLVTSILPNSRSKKLIA